MLDRIGQMNLNGGSSIIIIGFNKSPKKEWPNNHEFLTWEYGKHHLKQSDTDQLHCCTFALGGNFKHSHKENFLIKCLTCFSFFKRKVLLFLKKVNEEVSPNKKDEVTTIMAAEPNISYAVTE